MNEMVTEEQLMEIFEILRKDGAPIAGVSALMCVSCSVMGLDDCVFKNFLHGHTSEAETAYLDSDARLLEDYEEFRRRAADVINYWIVESQLGSLD